MLEQKSVQDLSDVATLTPGFRFSQEGGKNQPSLSLRGLGQLPIGEGVRSEEHTSELQSLMRISYDVFCLKTQKYIHVNEYNIHTRNHHTIYINTHKILNKTRIINLI